MPDGIIAIWLVLIAYWLISARGVKKSKVRERSRWGWSRVPAGMLIYACSRSRYLQFRLVPRNAMGDAAAIALCATGVAIAIWSRRRLGTNWSTVPSIKEGHELVTSGPYRFVRHPIYSGILLALLGTALASGVAWWIALALLCPVFAYRIKAEERLMLTQFPSEYAEYRAGTNALIPFVW